MLVCSSILAKIGSNVAFNSGESKKCWNDTSTGLAAGSDGLEIHYSPPVQPARLVCRRQSKAPPAAIAEMRRKPRRLTCLLLVVLSCVVMGTKVPSLNMLFINVEKQWALALYNILATAHFAKNSAIAVLSPCWYVVIITHWERMKIAITEMYYTCFVRISAPSTKQACSVAPMLASNVVVEELSIGSTASRPKGGRYPSP